MFIVVYLFLLKRDFIFNSILISSIQSTVGRFHQISPHKVELGSERKAALVKNGKKNNSFIAVSIFFSNCFEPADLSIFSTVQNLYLRAAAQPQSIVDLNPGKLSSDVAS